MLEIRTITSLPEAEKIWRQLSPNFTLYDDWNFRVAFYPEAPYPLLFLVAYESETEEVLGLLPLQKHPRYGYEFFAEYPCEESRPFIKPGRDEVIPFLYAAIPGPGKLCDISGTDPFTTTLPLEEYKYFLPLARLTSFADFLNTRLNTKRRRALVKEIEGVEKLAPKINTYNQHSGLEALERLFVLNINNFKDDSYLQEDDRLAWRRLFQLGFEIRMIEVELDKQIVAVSFSILYNGTWDYLLTGTDFKAYPGLGKYLVKLNIEAAICEGAKQFDAGLGDCGWKHNWHLERKEQYELEVKLGK